MSVTVRSYGGSREVRTRDEIRAQPRNPRWQSSTRQENIEARDEQLTIRWLLAEGCGPAPLPCENCLRDFHDEVDARGRCKCCGQPAE